MRRRRESLGTGTSTGWGTPIAFYRVSCGGPSTSRELAYRSFAERGLQTNNATWAILRNRIRA